MYRNITSLLSFIILAIAFPAMAATTPWNRMPELSKPGSDSPRLYAIVSQRGANIAGWGTAFQCGYLAADTPGKAVGMRVASAETDALAPEGLWYLLPGEAEGSVKLVNYHYADAGVTANPGHILTDDGTLGSDWYILPNGVNDNGLCISSSQPFGGTSCLDASASPRSNDATLPFYEDFYGLSNGWRPYEGDADGTSWTFVPVDLSLPQADLIFALRNAFYKPTGKRELYHHTTIWDIAQLNYVEYPESDYARPDSRFSDSRSLLTKYIAFYWEPEFGDNPSTAYGRLQMPMDKIAGEIDGMFEYFYNNLGFIDKGFSCMDRYYTNLYIFRTTKDGSLYAVGQPPVSYMCIHPYWFSSNPTYFGGVAHELAHTFQGAAEHDGRPGMWSGIAEMAAQFMINSYYGNRWVTLEPSHIQAFMQQTHLAFLHKDNLYHHPFVMEYWAQQHGRDIVGRLYRYPGSTDPVVRYKQMMEMTQDDFNAEMFDAARHFVNWDLDNSEAYAPYRNAHAYNVKFSGNGTYKPVDHEAPMGYGYNAIELNMPATYAERRVTLEFKGKGDNAGNSNPVLAGWRYGFVAPLRDGTTAYSPMYSGTDELNVWEVPAKALNLWLVVMGAPDDHYVTDTSMMSCNDRFDYSFRLTGTGVKGYHSLPLDEQLAMSGIDGITTDDVQQTDGDASCHDLLGRPVDFDSATSGIYIIRQGGKVKKVRR